LSGFEDLLSCGLVLTGGSSLISGIEGLAEEVFQRPVRIGVPMNIGGLADVVSSPQYATAVGLLMYGKRDLDGKRFSSREESSFAKVIRRMRAWFEGLFF
jgi:cell division protein FtsA